jgi:hypothetical protein
VNGNQSDDSSFRAGAAYVFVRSGTSWSQQAYLKASNTGKRDAFGFSLSVSDDTVVVGAYGEASNATGVNGDQAFNGSPDAGAAYVFVRGGPSWSQQAYLKASNTRLGDIFGLSVSVSGDTVVVGAPYEYSNATGVNGDQSDNSADYSGAAYLFVRVGTTWSQQGYLKASNTNAEDVFGGSVSVAGDTVVVGAPGEDSSATGVNGDQSDNSADRAGAAYVFTLCPPSAYCTGKTTSAGCVPFVSFSGTPSATTGPFHISSNDHIEAQPAIYLYSVKKANLDFHDGKLCVRAPFKRLTSLIKATDGLACAGCAGNCRMLQRDFNQWIQTGTDPMLTPGQQVHVQVRQSDPANLGPTGFADNLSDALTFTVGL